MKKLNFNEIYLKQVSLLLRVLPYVADQSGFCLKGGTAINLFIRDMPRLSVDIDLVYHPLKKREDALQEIENSLSAIKKAILNDFSEMEVAEKITLTDKRLNKLFVKYDEVQIVIEPNTILRGTLYPIEKKDLSKKAEDLLGITISNIPVLSTAEVYAGKICAALDRQHPRCNGSIS